MGIRDYLSTENDREVSDVEILNAIRESEGGIAGTSDVAEAVGMSIDGARDRLQGLRAEERVTSRAIGNSKNYTLVWTLAPGERQEPVHPEIDRLARWCDNGREVGDLTLLLGKVVGYVSAAALVIGLAAILGATPVAVPGGSQLAAYGFSGVVTAGAVLAIGGAIKWGLVVVERQVERRIDKQTREASGLE